MTTSLPLHGVFRYVQYNFRFILSTVNIQIKAKAGLLFVLNMVMNRNFFVLKNIVRETVYLNKS